MKGCDNIPFEAGMVEGANLERRRIRRALKWAIEVVRREAIDRQLAPSPTPLDLALNAIDAATRARRRKKK